MSTRILESDMPSGLVLLRVIVLEEERPPHRCNSELDGTVQIRIQQFEYIY